MKNYYEVFGLKRHWSQRRLLLFMEHLIKSQIAKGEETADALAAFRIFLSEDAKKIYDLNLSSTSDQLRSRPFIAHYINRTQHLLADADLHTIFSEKHFWAANWQLVLSRTLGVDFVLSGLGTKTHLGELTGLHRTSVAATKIYFYFYFGIPLVLGYHINAWFYVLIVPILLLKMFKEYRRAKNAYYQRWLNVVSKP